MQVLCLDMEGVLVPEIWIEFSKRTGIPEFSRTTRDEPDYDKLMRWRIAPSCCVSLPRTGRGTKRRTCCRSCCGARPVPRRSTW